MKKPDLASGAQFGRLTVLSKNSKRGISGKSYYDCRCSCENLLVVSRSELVTGKQKSCGCFRRAYAGFAFKGPPGKASFNALFLHCRRGAKNRKIEFALTREEHAIIVVQDCFYCGTKPQPYNVYLTKKYAARKKKISQSTFDDAWIVANGVDRVDSTVGYFVTNCVPCCAKCNYGKLDYTADEYIAHCYAVVAYQEAAKKKAG